LPDGFGCLHAARLPFQRKSEPAAVIKEMRGKQATSSAPHIAARADSGLVISYKSPATAATTNAGLNLSGRTNLAAGCDADPAANLWGRCRLWPAERTPQERNERSLLGLRRAVNSWIMFTDRSRRAGMQLAAGCMR
jgi:hypothetical protein